MIGSSPPLYRATLASGDTILCNAVVMATGPTSTPSVPHGCQPSTPLLEDSSRRPGALPLGECLQRWPVLHTNDLFALTGSLISGHRRPVSLTSGLVAATRSVGASDPGERPAPVAEQPSPKRGRRRCRRAAAARRRAPRQASSPPLAPASRPAGEEAARALLSELYAGRRVVVVGGGLSAGHLCLSAIERGADSVCLIVRSKHGLRVRQFDIPFSWTGRWRNAERLEFLSRPLEERLKLLQTLRAGGSVTPEVWKRLASAEECGKLTIRAGVTADSIARSGAHAARVELSDGTAVAANLVLLATGCSNGAMVAPGTLLGDLLSGAEGEGAEQASCGGLPLLTESLELPRCPGVHVLGAGAALTLGPDALNLMGARAGADRVREPLLRLLDEGADEDAVESAAYTFANGNCFALLA